MAEDIQRPLNLKKSFLKKDNEEEPIIIAQRFLNIFRQLHIFTAERKEAFNTMILDLPPEIRGMFGSLPGGSILQEYVDDLEQKSGISRDKTLNISSEISEEISKAKILATALAEAQIAAAAKVQTQAPIQPIQHPQPTQPERVQTAVPENKISSSEKVVADASFAKEIASAVKEAIMYTESTRRKETDEITKVLATSQAKLAQMVMQNNSAAASSSSNNNANNIQINTAATFPPIEDMVSGIVKAQSELFREMAKTQTAELSAIISVALKESQQLSTQTIVEAIRAFQKENLKILSLRAATKDFESEDDEITPSVKTKQKKTESKKNSEEPVDEIKAKEEISEIIEETSKVAEETIVETIEEAPKKKKKKKKKKKNKQITEEYSSESPSIPSTEKYEYVLAKNIDELPTENSIDESEWEWKYEEVPIEEISAETSNSNLDISLFDSEISDIKQNNKNLDLSIFDNETPQSTENTINSEDEFEWAYEEVEIEEEHPIEQSLENKIDVASSITENEENWEWEYETVEETIEEAPAPTDNIILAEKNENIPTFDFNLETDDELEHNDSEEKTISNQTSSLKTNKFGFSNKEDDFDNFSLGIDNPPVELNLDEEVELEITEDDAFNFVESEAEEQTPIEPSLETDKNQIEDRLEHKGTEEEAPVEPIQVAETAIISEDNTVETGEEWEWEYEEVEEDTPAEPIQVAETAIISEDNTVEAGEEWEWEYEEVEEEAPVEPIQVAETAIISEDNSVEAGEEWEWEYEEVEEDTPAEVEEDNNNKNNLTNSFALADPYQNLITDKKDTTNEEIGITNLSAIYTGEVYFQEDVLGEEKSKVTETNKLSKLIDAEIGIPELNKDDNNEPYKPKII